MAVAIIQARMTSSRLPGKVLAEVDGVPLLKYLLQRISSARTLERVVVATTINPTDDPVVGLCDSIGIDWFRGTEEDVLLRYYEAAAQTPGGPIVRLTADCPMMDPRLVDEVVEAFEASNLDYLSNTIQRTYPDGLDVEVFAREALERAHKEATEPHDREHVTPYIHCGGAQQVRFRVGQHCFGADFGHLRWTVDTSEDLDRVRRLVARLPQGYAWLEALAEATKEPELLGSQA